MQDQLQVAIIDFRMGNLFSVYQACQHVGLSPIITSDPLKIRDSDALILPGVGAFGDTMDNLRKLGLINPIKNSIKEGKPIMGICLGMQLLMSESEEFGKHKGLNVIEGSCIRFPPKNNENETTKVPNVGWSSIFRPTNIKEEYWNKSPLKGISNGEFMYFVHSYYVKPKNKDVILSTTSYEGTSFCSSLYWRNVFACQFHPEKSAQQGLDIYKNWASIIKSSE